MSASDGEEGPVGRRAGPEPDVYDYLDHRRYLADWIRWMKRRRPSIGVTRRLARESGLSQAGVSLVVRGRNIPRPGTVEALADALRLDEARRDYLHRMVARARARGPRARSAATRHLLDHPCQRRVRVALGTATPRTEEERPPSGEGADVEDPLLAWASDLGRRAAHAPDDRGPVVLVRAAVVVGGRSLTDLGPRLEVSLADLSDELRGRPSATGTDCELALVLLPRGATRRGSR